MKLIGKILVGIILAFFLFMGSLLVFNNQTKTYSTDLSCEEIRDCIILEYSCLDRHIENKYFMWEWEFDDKAFFTTQKEYYKEECLNILNSSEVRNG